MKRIILAFFIGILFLAVADFYTSTDSIDDDSQKKVLILGLQSKGIIHEFDLPESIEVIEEEAFAGTAINTIQLNDTVKIIGDRAFANISTLRTIRIPVTTTRIATSAFKGSNQVTINASPNSFARKFAQENDIPFTPLEMFCAVDQGTVNITVTSNSNKDIAFEPSENQEPKRQWQRFEETKVVGFFDIIFINVRGRGPPVGRC